MSKVIRAILCFLIGLDSKPAAIWMLEPKDTCLMKTADLDEIASCLSQILKVFLIEVYRQAESRRVRSSNRLRFSDSLSRMASARSIPRRFAKCTT